MQYNIAKHDGTLCENLLNKCFVNYFSGFPLIANGGVITMYINALQKQNLLSPSLFIFKLTLDITICFLQQK